jgi:tetratricopeptide (TPR) repeat protein
MAQSTTSEADMADAQARAHFRLGAGYYEAGRFAEAAQEFEIAYGLSGRGQLLYNVYLAYRDAQDTPNAARALRGYLAAVPDAADRDHLQARLSALEATVTADQEAEAARAAQQAEQRRQVEEAEQRAVDAELRASQQAQAQTSRPWWPWLLAGGGAVLAGVGVGLGVVASQDADALRRSCVTASPTTGLMQPIDPGPACAPSVDLASRRSTIQTEAAAADALWITGAVVGVTGIVLALVLPDERADAAPASTPPPQVSGGCSPTGCFGSVTVSF